MALFHIYAIDNVKHIYDIGITVKEREQMMTRFEVYYYDLHVGTIFAPNRIFAVQQMGVRFGGQVGITLK